MSSGKLEAIWIKRARKGPMDPVESASLVAEEGIVGNANQGGRRQVTVIEREAWARALESLGEPVEPSARRANLMVSGVELRETRDRILRVGACRIRVGGETRPCNRMDDAAPGLQDALDPEWRGGIYGVVLDDGEIRVGDPVAWETRPAAREGGLDAETVDRAGAADG